MSPVDVRIVRRKLAAVVSAIDRLRPVVGLTIEAWQGNRDLHDATERRLQLGLEAAIDINAHLVVGLGHPAHADAFSSFHELASVAGVLPSALASELAPSAGLRNRLVHRYDDLDDELVFRGVAMFVNRFPEYVEIIDAWLRGRER
jgi:uncharacterized protein YutE (UPF0331/DUF86 family)